MKGKVKKIIHFGDFIKVGKIPYQIVEYSFESVRGGLSRFIAYYNPFASKNKQFIQIDYLNGSVERFESVVLWENNLSLDLEYLKGGLKE